MYEQSPRSVTDAGFVGSHCQSSYCVFEPSRSFHGESCVPSRFITMKAYGLSTQRVICGRCEKPLG